jgi:RNA polymerase sigma factor for flagellar operon FliA
LNDPAVVELRVQDGLALLHRHARRLHIRYLNLCELEELVSTGFIGLRQAAERFDPSRGVPFERYAWYRIDGEMMRFVRERSIARAEAREAGRQAVTLLDDQGNVLSDDGATHRRRLATYCDSVLAAMLAGAVSQATATESSSIEPLGERLDFSKAIVALRTALGQVEPAAAQLVEQHYLEGIPLKDIASQRGQGYATVRRHHQAALASLGSMMRALGSAEQAVPDSQPPSTQQ